MREAVDATSPPPTASRSASGSSFYMATRILPAAQRDAMFEIYRFCREVDDIADSTGPRPIRIGQLGEWRDEINDIYEGKIGAKVVGLDGPVRQFGLRREDFLAVIDGMEMDAREDIRAPSFATLDLYCDRVASAVGRLSVRVFGVEDGDGKLLSHHLGRALQLTNILRDLDEDAAIGRLYLPRELLTQAGIDTDDPIPAIGDPRVDRTCRALAAAALDHFAAADRLLRSRPRGRLLAPRLMAAVYRALLQDMLASGWKPPRRRARIGKPRLLYLVARASLFG